MAEHSLNGLVQSLCMYLSPFYIMHLSPFYIAGFRCPTKLKGVHWNLKNVLSADIKLKIHSRSTLFRACYAALPCYYF